MGYFFMYEKDRIDINIEKLHEDFNNVKLGCSNQKFAFSKLDRFLYKKGQWIKLVDSGLKRYWFGHFEEYWYNVYGGRRLNFNDFFYLFNLYRSWFSNVEVDEKDKDTFIKSWQDPRNIYILLHYVHKLAVHPFSYVQFEKILKEKKGGNILEYGAGMAPIVTSMLYNNKNDYHYYL